MAQRDEILLETVFQMARDGKKIGLIKELRSVSGNGLKDAKDAIEACRNGNSGSNGYGYDMDKLRDEFGKYIDLPVPSVTKEQFIGMIEDAIDCTETMHYKDMLDAVHTLCSNMKMNGGLEVVAKKNQRFLEAI
jgi:hypothetical protein